MICIKNLNRFVYLASCLIKIIFRVTSRMPFSIFYTKVMCIYLLENNGSKTDQYSSACQEDKENIHLNKQ